MITPVDTTGTEDTMSTGEKKDGDETTKIEEMTMVGETTDPEEMMMGEEKKDLEETMKVGEEINNTEATFLAEALKQEGPTIVNLTQDGRRGEMDRMLYLMRYPTDQIP